MKEIDSYTFTTELVRESGYAVTALGEHESTMTLYFDKEDAGHGMIEWVIESLDEVEHIGLTFGRDDQGNLKLLDYDGVFSIPEEAIQLLRKNNITVDEEYEQ